MIEATTVYLTDMNTISSIWEYEKTYTRYESTIPRTGGFLSHKRSSAQGMAGKNWDGNNRVGRIWQELKGEYNIFLDSEATFDLHGIFLFVFIS